jgi:hypothetical protein
MYRWTEIGCEDMDWIQLVQDRVQWQALVSTFGFHKRQEMSWLLLLLLTSQK